MHKIEKNKVVNAYIDEATIVNKYLYFKDEDKEFTKYFIIKVNSITSSVYSTKYNTSQCHYFCVPKNNHKQCFTYDDIKVLNIDCQNITLYEMSFDEYIETFRMFIKLDGKYPNELPSKIIQDYTNSKYKFNTDI